MFYIPLAQAQRIVKVMLFAVTGPHCYVWCEKYAGGTWKFDCQLTYTYTVHTKFSTVSGVESVICTTNAHKTKFGWCMVWQKSYVAIRTAKGCQAIY